MKRSACALAMAAIATGCATNHYPQGEYKLLIPSSALGYEVLRKGLTFEDCRYLSTETAANFPSLLNVVNTMIDQHEDGEALANLKIEITQQYRGFQYTCVRASGDVVRLPVLGER